MVTQPGANRDVQVARFFDGDSTFGNWKGVPIEIGARGGVVQLWGAHFYMGQVVAPGGGADAGHMALSSNPEHEGVQVGLGLDDFFGPPLYATSTFNAISEAGLAGAFTRRTAVIPLYGIIRPRRQIWVLYLVSINGGLRSGLELYYSEVDATLRQEAQVNAKYGKYRRGR